jgi:hypothetical protein
MTMRHLVNALEGNNDKSRERWEQARLIAWYSAFDRKPMDITKIRIPCDDVKTGRGVSADQGKKQEIYKVLEKWSK